MARQNPSLNAPGALRIHRHQTFAAYVRAVWESPQENWQLHNSLSNIVTFPSNSPKLTPQERQEVERFRADMAKHNIRVEIGEFATGRSGVKQDHISISGKNGSRAVHVFRPGGTDRFLIVDLMNHAQVTQHLSIHDALKAATENVCDEFPATAA